VLVPVIGFLDKILNFIHNPFKLGGTNRAFFRPLAAPPIVSGGQISRLPSFWQPCRDFVNPFITGKTASAVQAFSSSTDDITFTAFSRINDFVFQIAAKWTFH
jgi:hypothetical protein